MRTFSMTDKGRTRDMNQDYVFSSETPVGNLPNLFIVADGMGGHNAGDYASRYAVEIMVQTIRECKKEEPAAIFAQAVEAANQKLLEKAAEDIHLSGMGTTAVLASVYRDGQCGGQQAVCVKRRHPTGDQGSFSGRGDGSPGRA